MNYRKPGLRSALAAEYVLGTLRGAARRRFERLLQEDFVLREEVQNWQNDLYPSLLAPLPEQQPPERVWQSIQQTTAGKTTAEKTITERQAGFWSSLDFWRLWGTATTVLVVALLIFISAERMQWLPHAPADLIAVLENQASAPAWLVQVDRSTHRLDITTLAPQPRPPDRRFDFWLVPPQPGRDPILLGQLPASGAEQLQLPKDARTLLDDGIVLAVTLEPLLGSFSGESIGPVLYQGRLLTP